MANANRKLFVANPVFPRVGDITTIGSPVPPKGIPTTYRYETAQSPASGNSPGGNPMSFISGAMNYYNNLPPEGKTAVGNIIDGVKGKVTSVFSGKPVEMDKSYGLSPAPNPKAIRLNSGLVGNTYTNDFLEAVEGHCSPLHVSASTMQIPVNAAHGLTEYFKTIIAFDIQTKAQANVGFDVGVSTDFTVANITAAMNTLIDALQIYYYFKSVMSYQTGRNENAGMIALRGTFTAQVIDDVMRLGDRLSDTPCPPRLLEWIRYMNGNYYSGMNQGSPLLKIVPRADCVNGTGNGNALPLAALASLNSDANNKVYALMRRAVPHWRIGVLYDVPVEPVYDPQFLTIFANLPFIVWRTSALVRLPVVTDDNTAISYNSYHNILDGVAFSATSVWNSVSSQWLGGWMKPGVGPNSALGVTRWSYYRVGAAKAFYDPALYPFLIRSRPETYLTNDANTSELSIHQPGTDKCLNVNVSALTQTSRSSLGFLMTLDSIKTKKKQSGLNKNAKVNK